MEKDSHQQTDSEDEADMFCPALPPHLLKGKSDNVSNRPTRAPIVGPTLPPNFKPSIAEENAVIPDEEESEDEEKDVVGPLPSAAADDERFNVPEMEERVKGLIKSISKDNKEPVREAWMLELPSNKPNLLALGLGPRQFRKKNVEDSGDRSVWTDTPQDKEKKSKLKSETQDDNRSLEDAASKKRDEELTDLVRKYENNKRSAPLVETHKQKRAKADEGEAKQRRPFSREEDLRVNRFDEAQKETILKKARQLNDRFSSGNRKFL